MSIIIKEDIRLLIEHLEARGIVVDDLLMQHLVKINESLVEGEL